MDNNTLPIESFKKDILSSDSPYIIVEAETGSGKSTMVPLWYRELGMRVLVTEPLIETVIGTSEYVAELSGTTIGNEIGYRTGNQRCDSPNSEVLFCTDGLALVRELAGHNQFDILVIDELHEWNTNQSTLEAWAWKHLCDGDSPFKKIVVLSATLASDELSVKRGNAPVFKVPGRQYPIIDRQPGMSVVSDIRTLVGEGYDVLCFQPGKKEIADTIEALEGLDAELIPFHGEVERSEKNKAYKNYNRPKVVVSTNALETGRTLLPSKGRKLAVVDSGMERRIELVDGKIEILTLKPIPLARGKQRRGRTGRVGEGVYIDHCPTNCRSDYPVPEILRTRLDQTVLRLAIAGYDATELPFFHQLDSNVIADAKRSLKALGAFCEDHNVTKTGTLMAKLPLSVQFSRMIVEAEKRCVVDDVVTIAAILETDSLRDRTGKWKALTQESESDLLAELDIWQAARKLKRSEMRDAGIFAKSYFNAKDLREKLAKALRANGVKFGSNGDRVAIKKSCVAGMVDHLYRNDGWGEYRNGGGDRKLGKESVVSGSPDWLVGLPKDIEFENRRGRLCSLSLVVMATKVDPMWLTEVAPQLVKLDEGLSPYFDAEKDCCVSTTKTQFNGQLVKEERIDTPEHQDAADVFCNWIAGKMSI